MDFQEGGADWLTQVGGGTGGGGGRSNNNNNNDNINNNNNTSSSSNVAKRPPFGLTVLEENGVLGEKDITVLHSKWDADKTCILVPGQRRLAIQWQSAYTYFSHDGHEVCIFLMFACI